MQLREGVAALAEAVADEPRVEVGGVPDDERAHGVHGTDLVDVASPRHGRPHDGLARRHRRGRGRHLARRQADAGPDLAGAVRADRARRRAQGGEPAANGRVQAPRGDEQVGVTRRRGGQRRDRRQRREPCPGPRLRRPPLRRPVQHLRARRRADHQGRGVPGLWRRGRRGRRLARRGGGRGTGDGRRASAAVLPPVRRSGRGRRAGHAGPRAGRGHHRPGLRRDPARRWRARRRGRPSP